MPLPLPCPSFDPSPPPQHSAPHPRRLVPFSLELLSLVRLGHSLVSFMECFHFSQLPSEFYSILFYIIKWNTFSSSLYSLYPSSPPPLPPAWLTNSFPARGAQLKHFTLSLFLALILLRGLTLPRTAASTRTRTLWRPSPSPSVPLTCTFAQMPHISKGKSIAKRCLLCASF